MKPDTFFDGDWDSHVHWTKTGRQRPVWQCRLVRSRVDGRFKGVTHLSNARGYAQFTLSWGVRYKFALTSADVMKKHWGQRVIQWEYLPVVGALPDSPHGPLHAIGELFSAFLAAEQLCGRWGGPPNLEWGRPHVIKPCSDCPAPIIYRLKLRGAPELKMPVLPKWAPQPERVIEHKKEPAKRRAKPQLEMFDAG